MHTHSHGGDEEKEEEEEGGDLVMVQKSKMHKEHCEAAEITNAAQSCAGLKGSSLSRVLPTCMEIHALMLFVVRKRKK